MEKPTVRLLSAILMEAAPRIGATVVLEPVWNFAGQITFSSGRRRYFRDTSLDINPMGASAIAKDKDQASFFMSRMGFPTVPGEAFFSEAWARRFAPARTADAAWRYAQQCGLPVIVKPNGGTGGRAVALADTKADFYDAMQTVFREDHIALVQRVVSGRDYRIVVFDDRVVAAYERIPLNIVGDGRSAIWELLAEKIAALNVSARTINVGRDDPRIVAKLRRQQVLMTSVPAAGDRIYLLDNANLSSGGDADDVSAQAHPKFREIAVRLTREMGLRLCGVDLIVDGWLGDEPATHWVLEINSAPHLDHFASLGTAQKRIVEKLYFEVLKALDT